MVPYITKYGEIAQLARACGSYPQCRGFESPSRYLKKKYPSDAFFLFSEWNLKYESLRSSGEGARRPGDVCLVRTEAERRPNPPLATNKKESNRISFLLVLKDNFETEIPRSSTYGAKRLGDKP